MMVLIKLLTIKTGIPFISVENIDNIYNTEKYISEEDYEKL